MLLLTFVVRPLTHAFRLLRVADAWQRSLVIAAVPIIAHMHSGTSSALATALILTVAAAIWGVTRVLLDLLIKRRWVADSNPLLAAAASVTVGLYANVARPRV
jgi:hypothetical protein